MVAALGQTTRKVYRRAYESNGLRVVVEVVNNRGVLSWFSNWYAVDRANRTRFVFGSGGNGDTLREVWGQVRAHTRTYLGGCDVVYMKGGK